MIPLFIIPGNTPSSKNSKQWTGKYLVDSKVTQRWKKETEDLWITDRIRFVKSLVGLNKPYYIEFTFYRDTNRAFDYNNASQAVTDAMVYFGWIMNDDSLNIKPYYGDAQLDRENPRVEIRILMEKPKHY